MIVLISPDMNLPFSPILKKDRIHDCQQNKQPNIQTDKLEILKSRTFRNISFTLRTERVTTKSFRIAKDLPKAEYNIKTKDDFIRNKKKILGC